MPSKMLAVSTANAILLMRKIEAMSALNPVISSLRRNILAAKE